MTGQEKPLPLSDHEVAVFFCHEETKKWQKGTPATTRYLGKSANWKKRH
nr:MAG TPA: hypothetical protein [Caudoviricetes sp.]